MFQETILTNSMTPKKWGPNLAIRLVYGMNFHWEMHKSRGRITEEESTRCSTLLAHSALCDSSLMLLRSTIDHLCLHWHGLLNCKLGLRRKWRKRDRSTCYELLISIVPSKRILGSIFQDFPVKAEQANTYKTHVAPWEQEHFIAFGIKAYPLVRALGGIPRLVLIFAPTCMRSSTCISLWNHYSERNQQARSSSFGQTSWS